MTIQAKIEIVSRNIDIGLNPLLPRPFQHLFLLYTENGEVPLFLSAAPAQGNPITDNIYVKTGKYTQYDVIGEENIDFEVCHKSPCFRRVQGEGDREEVFSVWGKMVKMANYINIGQIKYNLPICEATLGFFQMWGTQIDRVTTETATSDNLPPYYVSEHLCNTRNSNTVVAELVKSADIELRLPIYPDGEEVESPGVHSVFDKEVIDGQKGSKKKQEYTQSFQEDKAYTIQDMFNNLGQTEVLQKDITNRERALLMAKHASKQGNLADEKLYKNMAQAQGEIEAFFKNMPGSIKQDEKDEL